MHDNLSLVALQGLVDHGKYMAGMTYVCLNWDSDFKVADAKRISPKTKIMFRGRRKPEPSVDFTTATYQSGKAYAEAYFAVFDTPDSRLADFHQIVNEPSVGDPVHVAAWWNGALDVAKKLKLKLAVLCYSERQPPLPGINANQQWHNFWKHPDIIALLRRVKREGHMLTLHQYVIDKNGHDSVCESWARESWQTDKLYRHELVLKELPKDLQDIPIWLAEYGDINMLHCGARHLINNVRIAEANLASSNVVAACAWTWGFAASEEWADDDLSPYTKDYIAAVT